jgi:N-acetylneuraminic acid mutarotase
MLSARLKICIILCICLFCGCSKLKEPEVPIQFSELASLPVGRASASAFVVDGKAYVLCGRNADGVVLNDMWQYDINANVWVQQNDLPFKGRVKAIAQVVGGKVYVGLGYNGEVYQDSCYLRDFWKYTPATNMWTRCADFPNSYTNANITYVIGNNIYVCYGYGPLGFSRQICCYNIILNKWIEYEDNYKRAATVMGATGEQCNNRLFFGTGAYTTSFNSNDWYEFNPESDVWIKRANIVGGRVFAASVVGQESIFLLGGRHYGGTLTTGFLYDDILEYSISQNTWNLRGHLPGGGRENMITFSYNGKGYFGLGEDKDGKIFKDLYRWDY